MSSQDNNPRVETVLCTECAHEQEDNGPGHGCENCGYPISWRDATGALHDGQ